MKALGALLSELVALFVDDGALALMTVAWVACVAWVLPLMFGSTACALFLLFGLLVALASAVLRA